MYLIYVEEFNIGEYSELAPHEDVDKEGSFDDEFDDEDDQGGDVEPEIGDEIGIGYETKELLDV